MVNFFIKPLKKKYKNTIFLDGDEFRSLFGNDLKYTIRDRDKNAQRMTSFVKYLSNQKINLVISANLTSQRYRNWCRKNLKNFVQIYITANLNSLINRDYKGLYKKALKRKIKNVVGVDLPFKKPRGVDLFLSNDGSKKKFLNKIIIIKKFLAKKKIKIN